MRLSDYPKIFTMGHRWVKELLLDPVIVEEKLDGSQFSFGLLEDLTLTCRSKGQELDVVNPQGMFQKGVEYVKSIQNKLVPGWTYRGEFFNKPKHNTLAYTRMPENHVMIFEIDKGNQDVLPYEAKKLTAQRLGFECVPILFEGRVDNLLQIKALLETQSVLGGQRIEGVVIKNYHRLGEDGKILLGKYVSDEFKEKHIKEWKNGNPTSKDIVQTIAEKFTIHTRWQKAVQNLREAGIIDNSMKDIPHLMKVVHNDIRSECLDEIKDDLLNFALPHILRSVVRGLPEWYKEELLKLQFLEEQAYVHELEHE